jgi:hypothetical protein
VAVAQVAVAEMVARPWLHQAVAVMMAQLVTQLPVPVRAATMLGVRTVSPSGAATPLEHLQEHRRAEVEAQHAVQRWHVRNLSDHILPRDAGQHLLHHKHVGEQEGVGRPGLG